jgi:NADPH2:quinone reductase
VGKSTFETTLKCIALRGLFVSFGAASGAPPAVDATALREAGALYFTRPALNIYVGTRAELEASAGAVFDLVKRGVIKPNIQKRYALGEVAKAHAELEKGRTVGTSLLIPA